MPINTYKDGKKLRFTIDITNHAGSLDTQHDKKEMPEGNTPRGRNYNFLGLGSIIKRYGYRTISKKEDIEGGVRGLILFQRVGVDPLTQLVIAHENGEAYVIDKHDLEWTDKGAWGTDDGSHVRGITYSNLAIFGNGLNGNTVKKYDGDANVLDLANSPNGSIFEEYSGLLNQAGIRDTPSLDFWNEVDEPEHWSGGTTGNISIGTDNGQVLTMMKAHGDTMVIFKERKKYSCSVVFDENNFAVGMKQTEIIDQKGGAWSGDSVVSIDQGFMYLSRGEFQIYGLDQPSSTVRQSPSISTIIQDYIDEINWTEVQKKGTAALYKNRYLCATPTGMSTRNNRLWIYDFTYSSWRYWDDMPIGCFAEFDDAAGNIQLLWGHERDPKICIFSNEFNDDNKAIDFEWYSKVFMPSLRSRFETVTIYGSTTDPGESELILDVDGTQYTETISSLDSSIIQQNKNGPIGDNNIGQGNIGGVTESVTLPKMYRFKKKTAFPAYMNEGVEMYYGFRNSGINEGIKIDRVVITGELLPNP